MDDSQLQSPPAFSFTAASGAFCFLAAAILLWIFAPAPILPAASMSHHWQFFAYHLGAKPTEIATTSLARPTVALFGKQVDLSRPSVLRGTTFDHWSHRSSYDFSSLMGDAGNKLGLEFSSVPTCQLEGDGKLKHGRAGVHTGAAASTPMEFAQAKTLLNDQEAAKSMCAHAWLDVSATLSKDFQSFFAPSAAVTQAELEVQIGEVEQAPHYALSQRFWLQLDGSIIVAVVSNYSIPFHSSFGPLRRHSKHFLSEPPMAKFEGIEAANVTVIRLSPGDVLAIPPYAIVSSMSTANSSVTLKLNSMSSLELELDDISHELPVLRWIELISQGSDLSVEQAGSALSRFILAESTRAYVQKIVQDAAAGDQEFANFDIEKQASLLTANADSAAIQQLKSLSQQILKERYADSYDKVSCGTSQSLPSSLNIFAEIESKSAELANRLQSASKKADTVAWMDLIEAIALAASDSHPAAMLKCWSL